MRDIISSFPKAFESMNYFNEMKNKVLSLKEEKKIEEIEVLFRNSGNEFGLIDSKVVIDGDEDNMQL
ncbi:MULTISPECIES: hypothetical protein [unclassified Clostridium]|uniref:hypothetical protein n=1 Tax=unclassified Clostridium TaxID=2614128 RepID=UPI000297C666|nr:MULTISPECIES: hypothetical protein [unclassified Clostridium]EKQ56078.1 MAG: hypothetical protein A370_02300 [Clostridium sp. Maddingley MBC34-26]